MSMMEIVLSPLFAVMPYLPSWLMYRRHGSGPTRMTLTTLSSRVSITPTTPRSPSAAYRKRPSGVGVALKMPLISVRYFAGSSFATPGTASIWIFLISSCRVTSTTPTQCAP